MQVDFSVYSIAQPKKKTNTKTTSFTFLFCGRRDENGLLCVVTFSYARVFQHSTMHSFHTLFMRKCAVIQRYVRMTHTHTHSLSTLFIQISTIETSKITQWLRVEWKCAHSFYLFECPWNAVRYIRHTLFRHRHYFVVISTMPSGTQ